MEPTRFDELTKVLAATTSRRQALRRIGGLLAGATLASLLPGRALADNSACAHWCNEHFPPGSDRGQCKSDAAHGTGLCHSACGPGGSGGTLCGGPSYSATTCCAPPNTCGGGTPGVCGCVAHLQPCTSAAQCCSTDHTACAPNNVVIGQNVCCSTLGGACTTGGPSGDCCAVNVPEGQDYAYCSSHGTCGGPGAVCRFNEACVSGQCSGGTCI